MTAMTRVRKIAAKMWRRPNLPEVLLSLMIVAILFAILFPSVQWASSGNISLPVQVLVFDAANSKPLSGARVVIIRAPTWEGEQSLDNFRDRFPTDLFDQVKEENRGVTASDGTVTIRHEFTTGASHHRPISHAHLRRAWVTVQAEGYGGVVVPVRHESVPVATVREQKELLVPIGLMPIK